MPYIPLDSSELWELAREKSDLCESLPANRKPKTSHPKNNNDRTIACICRQLLVFISHKASKTLLLSRERATLLLSINPYFILFNLNPSDFELQIKEIGKSLD